MDIGTCRLCKSDGRILDGKGECVICTDIDWTRLEPSTQIDRHGKVIISDQSLQAIQEMIKSKPCKHITYRQAVKSIQMFDLEYMGQNAQTLWESVVKEVLRSSE